MEDVAQWVLDNRLRAHARFTVDDLVYLKRGGRISAVAATMGSMLDLKPILTLCRDGSMIASDKILRPQVRSALPAGKKPPSALRIPPGRTMVIMHADAEEDAKRLEAMIRERVPKLGKVNIVFVGPVIRRSRRAPAPIASVFMGKERTVESGK